MADLNKLFKDSLSKVGELTKNVDLNELASKSNELVKNTTKAKCNKYFCIKNTRASKLSFR